MFFLFPIIIFTLYLIKYIRTRDKYELSVYVRKYLIGLGIAFIILSFASESTFKTFEFLASGRGYIKTVVFQLSDYEEIDFIRSYTPSKYKSKYNRHRSLYIVRKCDEKQLLSYINDMINFLDEPQQTSKNTFKVLSSKYGKVWININDKGHYFLVEIFDI